MRKATRNTPMRYKVASGIKRPAKRVYYFFRGFFIEHDHRDKLWYATRNGVLSVFTSLDLAKEYCRWVTSPAEV